MLIAFVWFFGSKFIEGTRSVKVEEADLLWEKAMINANEESLFSIVTV